MLRTIRLAFYAIACLTFAVIGLGLCKTARADEPAIAGYDNYAALTERLQKLDASDLVKLESLGKTLGQRELWLLTLGAADATKKPAVLIVGSVHAPHLVGSQMSVQIAESLVAQAESAEVKGLLERFTLYIIPRPNPDASEAFFQKPYQERTGNDRSTDDDRDSELDEDPAEDINGDGWITTMRVEDVSGTWMPHPSDPRVLIEADPKKNERGKYRLYTEGGDNDGDEQFNEDGPGGVSLNRNFTFRYPTFEAGAGPHQVSEIESRALADFAFAHANIALVFTFTPEDNLFEPWKPNAGSENEKVKNNVLTADAELLSYVAEQYRTLHGGKDAPSPAKAEGSVGEWAYFHYGRWSLAARGWWIPKLENKAEEKPAAAEEQKPSDENASATPQPVDAPSDNPESGNAPSNNAKPEAKAEAAKPDASKPEDKKPEDAPTEAKPDTKPAEKGQPAGKPADEKRGTDDINALVWMKSLGIEGFVDWQPIEHPDFPGKKVEIGGFKPLLRLNPPASELPRLIEAHSKFLVRLGELMPKLSLEDLKVEALGGDVFRVSIKVANQSFLPSMPAMGNIAEKPHPVQVSLGLAEDMKLIKGIKRQQLPPIAGGGVSSEQAWLINVPPGTGRTLTISAGSPSVGEASKSVELK